MIICFFKRVGSMYEPKSLWDLDRGSPIPLGTVGDVYLPGQEIHGCVRESVVQS